jgi:hypothetical protein
MLRYSLPSLFFLLVQNLPASYDIFNDWTTWNKWYKSLTTWFPSPSKITTCFSQARPPHSHSTAWPLCPVYLLLLVGLFKIWLLWKGGPCYLIRLCLEWSINWSSMCGLKVSESWVWHRSYNGAFIDYTWHLGLHKEGIFRKSPASDELRLVKSQLNYGQPVDLDKHSIDVSTALLKVFLRELPVPVISVQQSAMLSELLSKPSLSGKEKEYRKRK